MNRAPLLCVVCLSALTGCGGNKDAKTLPPPPPDKGPVDRSSGHEVVSAAGSFKITFPQAPKKKVGASVEGKPIENYFLETPDKALIVGFSYPPIPLPKGVVDEKALAGGLDGAAQAFVKSVKATFTEKTPIRLDGYPGLAFQARTISVLPKESGAFKGRVYFVEGKLIRLVAIGQPAWIASKEVTGFLDSFALTK